MYTDAEAAGRAFLPERVYAAFRHPRGCGLDGKPVTSFDACERVRQFCLNVIRSGLLSLLADVPESWREKKKDTHEAVVPSRPTIDYPGLENRHGSDGGNEAYFVTLLVLHHMCLKAALVDTSLACDGGVAAMTSGQTAEHIADNLEYLLQVHMGAVSKSPGGQYSADDRRDLHGGKISPSSSSAGPAAQRRSVPRGSILPMMVIANKNKARMIEVFLTLIAAVQDLLWVCKKPKFNKLSAKIDHWVEWAEATLDVFEPDLERNLDAWLTLQLGVTAKKKRSQASLDARKAKKRGKFGHR
jgi:hypothetical protein